MKLAMNRNWTLALGVFALLVGLVLVLGLRTEPPAKAEPHRELDFPAMKPATSDVVQALPKGVTERLAFDEYSLEGQSKRDGGSADLELREFGQVDLPEGRASLAAIGSSVCAFFEYGIGVCEERDEIAADGVVGFSPQGCDAFSLIGIAPEAIATMTFDNDGDGSYETEVPVESNVYSATLKPTKSLAQGLSETGQVVFEDVIPFDEFAASNPACGGR